MNYCPNCGSPVKPGENFCGNCGARLQATAETAGHENNMKMPGSQGFIMKDPASTKKAATKKEFFKLPENEEFRKAINIIAIGCYILAALNLLLESSGILNDVYGDLGMEISMSARFFAPIVLAGIGLGIHLTQSRVFAVLLAVYAAINTIGVIVFMLSLPGGVSSFPGGLLVLFWGYYALRITFKLEKEWKEYSSK